MIRFAQLPLTADITAIQQEVNQLTHTWVPHLNTYHYTGSWKVTSLRSPGGTTNNSVPDITGAEQHYADTPLMAQCPAIQAFTASLQCDIMSVRLLNLQSGAVIKPHRDYELCFEKGEARLHVPVFTNSGVRFCVEEDMVPMQEGQSWYLNANITHSVVNNGLTDRIHLVIDCVVNDWLKCLFAAAIKDEVPDKVDVATTLAMIEALKTHNTDTAVAMIASLEAKLQAQY